jgi:hypothetical protein
VVQHYATILVEVREDVLADALRLQHMATRMYIKPFFCAGMHGRKTSGYLQLDEKPLTEVYLEGNSSG